MSLTRENFESELVSRQQARMETVEMSVETSGTNTDLNNIIGFAIRQSGGTVASFASVADSDLSGFDSEYYEQLFDIAELRLLKNIKGRWGKWDIRAGQLAENLSQFGKDLDADIERLEKHVKSTYGIGVSTVSIGSVDYDFAETMEETESDE